MAISLRNPALTTFALVLLATPRADAQRRRPSVASYGSYPRQYYQGLSRNGLVPAVRPPLVNTYAGAPVRTLPAVPNYGGTASTGGYRVITLIRHTESGSYVVARWVERIGPSSSCSGCSAGGPPPDDYLTSLQKTRILREQARMAAIERRKKELQERIEYERRLPNALTIRDRRRAAELDRARNDPPGADVWSGKSLNVLLQSAVHSGRVASGPNIPLRPETLQGINLRDPSSAGSVGLVKNGARLSWPMALRDEPFDFARDRFSQNLALAVRQVATGELRRSTYRTLQADLQTLKETLNASVHNLSTSEWIRARAYLKELKSALLGLSEPTAARSFDRSWAAEVKTVANLVNCMARRGLEFAPAAEAGDHGAYSSLYIALRAFEAAVTARK
jgi:hypothetical protein